jgi:hypothetical protein
MSAELHEHLKVRIGKSDDDKYIYMEISNECQKLVNAMRGA